MAGYFSSFTLVKRDADGYVDPFAGETLSVYDATDTLIDTVVSDAFGFVESFDLAVVKDTAIYFKHALFPAEFHQVTADTEDEALIQNIATQFIVEDLETAETDITEVDLWLWYPDTPEFQPVKIGTAAPGATLKHPIESFYSKTLKVSAVGKTSDFAQNANKLEDLPSSSFSLDSLESEFGEYVPASIDDASYTVTGDVTYTEEIVASSASAISLNLMFSAVAVNSFIARNDGAGLLTLTSEDNQTFNGAASYDVATGKKAVFISTGTNWLRII